MTAALLDIYGLDLAELFVVSTHPLHRGKGHAKASRSRLYGEAILVLVLARRHIAEMWYCDY